MNPPLDPDGFPVEADRFSTSLPDLDLDFSIASVARVQAWLNEPLGVRTDADRLGAGCYVGEVLRRTIGGAWQSDGTLAGLGAVAATSPLAKVRAGEDLVAYVADVERYSR